MLATLQSNTYDSPWPSPKGAGKTPKVGCLSRDGIFDDIASASRQQERITHSELIRLLRSAANGEGLIYNGMVKALRLSGMSTDLVIREIKLRFRPS
jgi:hypothetical protein